MEKKNPVRVFSVDWQMQRYNITAKEATEKIDAMKAKLSVSSKKMHAEMDKETKKAMTPKNKEHWIKKGYTLEESVLKAKQQGDQMRQVFKDKKRNNPDMYKSYLPTQKGYWTNKGWSEEEEIAIISDRQRTFTKDKCIDKYGPIEGLIIFENRQVKWQNTINSKTPEEIKRINDSKANTLVNFITRYGEDEGTLKYNKWVYKMTSPALQEKLGEEGYKKYCKERMLRFKNSYSNAGKKFVETLIDTFNISMEDHSSCLNEEWWINGGGKFYRYDFKYKNKLIEFNGDFWHANPVMYKDHEEILFANVTVGQIWEHDKNKISVATDKGFDVLTIWDEDYNKNTTQQIEIIKHFLFE